MVTFRVVYHLDSPDHLDALVDFSADVAARAGFGAPLASSAAQAVGSRLAPLIDAGFTEALVMPPADWQAANVERIVDVFARGDGWSAPYIDVEGLVPVGRPTGTYVLLIHHDPQVDDDLRGLTAPQLRRLVGEDRCLTVTEYLIVQRLLFERDGDHRFDDYSSEPSGWMWLAGSTDGTHTAMGYWNGSKARIEVTRCKVGSKNPRKGARRCRIIDLGPG